GVGVNTGLVVVFLSAGGAPVFAWKAPAAATAGCFGLEVTGLVFGAGGSTDASLCATGAAFSLLDPNRLRTKPLMLPEFSVEAGVPSEVHPANASAAATTVDVRSARTRRSISWYRTPAPNPQLSHTRSKRKLGKNSGGTRAGGGQLAISDSFGK